MQYVLSLLLHALNGFDCKSPLNQKIFWLLFLLEKRDVEQNVVADYCFILFEQALREGLCIYFTKCNQTPYKINNFTLL